MSAPKSTSLKKSWANAFLAAAALCAVAGAQAQSLYKWVDASGKTHYSDKPPAAGQAPKGEKELMKRNLGNNAAPDGLSAQRALAKKEVEQTKGSKSGKEAEAEAVAAAEREKTREKNCGLAKEAARVLGSGGRISVTDEKGEKRFLEEKEVSERLADMQRREQEACAPAPEPAAGEKPAAK